MSESMLIRVHDERVEPVLVYLPGLHGDWTLMARFRQALNGRACLVELTYPRREDWRLDDYAGTLETMLTDRGLKHGWLVAESFSSQVAWALVSRQLSRADGVPGNGLDSRPRCFEIQGVILAGGFVRHPFGLGVALAHLVSRHLPRWLLDLLCRSWIGLAQKRVGDNPEAAAGLREFAARRMHERDRAAITRRYRLILERDFRGVARTALLPVFLLSGIWDPVVPWPPVRRWLRQHCPGFRDSRILPHATHPVLLDAPAQSAEQILRWIEASQPLTRTEASRAEKTAVSSSSCGN